MEREKERNNPRENHREYEIAKGKSTGTDIADVKGGAPSAYCCPGNAVMRNVSTRSSDTRMISSLLAARPYGDAGG